MSIELKDLQDQLGQAVKSLRDAGDRAEQESKRFGEATQETKNMIEGINSRIDGLETSIKRIGQTGAPNPNPELDAKAQAFLKFVREGKAGMSPDERKALVEDSTGQIIVPMAVEQELYRALPKITVFRNLATVRTIGTDRIRRRSMTEVAVGWGKLETGGTLTESTLTPSEAFQYVEDHYGLTKIGEDELMDSDINLVALVSDSFSQAFAESEDTAFINGTGHASSQPEGLLNGTTLTRSTTSAVRSIKADDLISLAYDVPAQYRKNGTYVVASQTEKALRLLKDSQGQFLWQPSLIAGTPNSFNGYAIYTQDDIPTIPTSAGSAGTFTDIALFGDFKSGYRILDRMGMAIQRLNELYAEQGLVGFKAHRRVTGGVIRPNALRVLKTANA